MKRPDIAIQASSNSQISVQLAWFARLRHFTTTTIILQGFAFLCKLGLLSFKPPWDNPGFEPGRAIAPIPNCNWNCPFKKRPRGQFVPFKILGKNSKGSTHEDIYFSTEIASWNRTWKVYFIAPLNFIPELRFSHALLLFADSSRGRGAAKFGRNLIKYMSVQHIWNLFQL